MIDEFCHRWTWLSTATPNNSSQTYVTKTRTLLVICSKCVSFQADIWATGGAPMLTAAVVFAASDAGPKNFENMSGRQFTRDSWNVAYGRMNVSFFESGRLSDHLAALSAMSAKAILSSNMLPPETETDGGRKCLSHSGMWLISQLFARQYVNLLVLSRQSTFAPLSVQVTVVYAPPVSGVHLQVAI